MNKKLIPKNYILIKENFDYKICENRNRWEVEEDGFHIKMPLIGFIKKSLWKSFYKAQNFNFKKIQSKKEIEESEKNIKELFKDKNINSTIIEFDLLTGIFKGKIFTKAILIIGRKKWIEVSESPE